MSFKHFPSSAISYFMGPTVVVGPSSATSSANKRMVPWGVARVVTLANYRECENSFLAPSGYAGAFPRDAPFTRDLFVDLPLCFGAGVFRVSVEHVREVPREDREAMIRCVNRVVRDRSEFPPKLSTDDDESWWAPSLGRGGRVGLYQHVGDDAEVSWWNRCVRSDSVPAVNMPAIMPPAKPDQVLLGE